MLYETVELRSPRFWPRFILILDSQPSELILPPCWHLWQSGDARIEESLTDNCNDRWSSSVQFSTAEDAKRKLNLDPSKEQFCEAHAIAALRVSEPRPRPAYRQSS